MQRLGGGFGVAVEAGGEQDGGTVRGVRVGRQFGDMGFGAVPEEAMTDFLIEDVAGCQAEDSAAGPAQQVVGMPVEIAGCRAAFR